MTKNANNKLWSWASDSQGSGGTFNSNQQLGGDQVLSVDGSGFGGAPTVIMAAKWTDGKESEQVELDSPEIGDFDEGSYASGLLPKFFSMDGSTGASIREGGTDAVTDNRLTGFVKVVPNFTEYLISYDSGVPEGRNFSSTSTPETMPVISPLKMAWLSDQPLDDVTKADIVTFSWVGNRFSLVGNQAPTAIGAQSGFTFNQWNNYLAYQKAGVDPFVDNGISEIANTDPSAGTFTEVITDQPIFDPSADNAWFNHINFPAWTGNGDQDLTQHLFRYAYIAVGDNARARLELGNNADYTLCTKKRIIPHDSWTDTNVTVTTDSKQRENMSHWFITNADGTRQSGEL